MGSVISSFLRLGTADATSFSQRAAITFSPGTIRLVTST